MNIDLKRQAGGSVRPYPRMPKLGEVPNAAATVLMFDLVFNPETEVVNSSPQFNSVNPANRFRSFASRHNKGGQITFVDGHAAYFKTKYIQDAADTSPDVIFDAFNR
jgi:prepilin-type processing-associated H-X9-DG protein